MGQNKVSVEGSGWVDGWMGGWVDGLALSWSKGGWAGPELVEGWMGWP